MTKLIHPDEVVAYARSWKGARWRHQGRGHGPRRDIDCAGVLVRTMQHFGMEYEDVKGYGRTPNGLFQRKLEQYTDPGSLDMNLHGAIGVFHDTIMPIHTGVFAVDPVTKHVTVIHSEAYPKMRCHEEGFLDSIPSLRDRLVSVRLFRGVNYVQ